MSFLSKLLLVLAIGYSLIYVLSIVLMFAAGAFNAWSLAHMVIVIILWSAARWSNNRDKERPFRNAMKRDTERQNRNNS